MEVFLLRQTTCFWVIMWTEENSLWKPSVCCQPIRSNIQKTSFCCEETMNVLALTEYTASMMNVSMGKANQLKINFNVRAILTQHNFWIMGTDICRKSLWLDMCYHFWMFLCLSETFFSFNFFVNGSFHGDVVNGVLKRRLNEVFSKIVQFFNSKNNLDRVPLLAK